MFIIHTDIEPYLYIVVTNNSHLSLTTDIHKATIFSKKKTVENLVKSNLNSKKKRIHNYTYSSVQKLGLDMKNKEDVDLLSNNTSTKLSITNTTTCNYLNPILSEVQDIQSYAIQAQQKLEELMRNLSNIDKACTDLDHYMELNNLSASEGWKAYKQKQKLLKVRRMIKNQIFSYQQIVNPLKSYINGNVTNSIEGLKTQKYTPRIMTGLFDIKKDL